MFRNWVIRTVLHVCIAIGLIFLPVGTAFAGTAQMTKVAAMQDDCKTPPCCQDMKSKCAPSDACIGMVVSFLLPAKLSTLGATVVSKQVYFATATTLAETTTIPLRRPPRI